MSLFALGLGLPVLQRTVRPTIAGTVWYAESSAAAPVNTALPTLPSTVNHGASVTASNGTWSGDPAPTFTYQWLSNGVAIGGATGQTYTPTATDRAAAQPSLAVRVTASNGVGSPVAATSAEATLLSIPANTVLPTVPAGPVVDVPVTAVNGTWTGTPTPTFTYQWLRNGVNITDAPATAQAYTPISTDSAAAQPSLAVRVTGTNSQGSASATSAEVTVSGTALTLEPVNGAFDQIAITVGSAEQQTWQGFGWGVGNNNDARNSASLIEAHQAALYDELGTKVIRIHNPMLGTFVSDHDDLIAFALSKGVDRILVTGYVFSASPDTTAIAFANAIDAAITAGIPITHVSLQNEPDGNAANAVALDAALVTYYQGVRDRLNVLGRTTVKIIGLEWAHFGDPDGTNEYALLNNAGKIPSTVALGAGHIYADGPATDVYGDRWGSTTAGRVAGLWSCETGGANSPNAQARALAGLNNGVSAEIFHQGQAEPGTGDGDLTQKLVSIAGTRQAYQPGLSVIFRDLPRDSIFRHCTSDDRPSGAPFGTLADGPAEHMYRRKQGVLSSTSNVFPRFQGAVAKRPDTSWIILGTNATDGAGVSGDPAGHGACYPGESLQMTVTMPSGQVATPTAVLTTRRASKTGTIITGTANMVNGQVRFTLAAGETIAITG